MLSSLWGTARARAVAASSVCQEFRAQLFPQGSTSYVQIRTSTKRGGGTTKNGRDSRGKRLGAKKLGGEYVIPGNIIMRQRGIKFHPGQHVGIGRDHTLYALEPGYLRYYEHHIAYPHIAESKMICQEAFKVSKPGTVDDGSRPTRTPKLPKQFPLVKHPRGMKRYVGIVRNRDDILPRDERVAGRDRHFWLQPRRAQPPKAADELQAEEKA